MIKSNMIYGFPCFETTGFYDQESGVLDKKTEDKLKNYIKEKAIPHLYNLIARHTEKDKECNEKLASCNNQGYKKNMEFFIKKTKEYESDSARHKESIAKFSSWIDTLESKLESELTIEDSKHLPCFR